MINLIVTDQTGALRPRVYPYQDGMSINDIIADKFGGLDDWKSEIYLDGARVLPQEKATLFKPLNGNHEVKVITEVKAVTGGFVGIAQDATSASLELLIDIPDLPEQDTQRGSPNNTYQSQSNVVRAFQQKAVVCGSPRIYPDLIQESIEYFENNIRVSEQYLFCSYGDFTGGTIQLGNTAATRFPATINRFQPIARVTTIPDFRVGQSVDEVDGQVIRGTNEGTVGQTYNTTDGATSATLNSGRLTFYVNQDAISDQMKSDFDNGLIDVAKVEYTVEINTPDGPDDIAGSGTGSVTSITLATGEYEVVVDSFNGPSSLGDYTNFTLSTIISSGVGPFATPIQTEKLLFNVAFRQGLNATVDFELVIYELDSKGGSRTGNNETFNFSYTDTQPNDAQNRTYEAQPARGRQWYEFEITRTNEESQSTENPDVPTLDSVYCIQELGDTDFDNATMLKTVIRSTPNATSGGVDNKINIVDGQQNMPSYNVNTGAITANAPSRKCADAVLFMLKDFHGYTDAQILELFDLDALYEIQNRLDAINPELAQFDFTFDDIRQGLLEQISIITNVMRVQYFSDGSVYSFWRDDAATGVDGVLSRTDVIAQENRDYSISRKLFVEGDKDSIQIEYIDRTINKPTFIYRRLNGTTIENVAGRNPKRVTLTGCQSRANAENRAELEIRRLMYQHTQGSDTFLNSAVLLNRGQVVYWDEIHETSGYVSGQFRTVAGNTATLNQPIDITKSYNLYFTNIIGDVVGPQAVTINGERSITVADLGEAYQPDNTTPLGSRFFLIETAVTPQRWRIMDKQVNGTVIQLTMNNYDPRIYEAD